MRINLGCIGKLGDESTRLKIIKMSKENPKILEEYESFVSLLDYIPNAEANLEIIITEKESEPSTILIPRRSAQKITFKIWDEYTPYENKLELVDGEALHGNEQRDRMLLMLLYNTGLEYFVNLLPEESKRILKELL